MKKIILAFDGTNFSEGAFEFARQLNKLNPIMLTGVFLPQVMFANLWSYSIVTSIPLLENDDAELINENITHFETLCKLNEIDYSVHKHFFDFGLPELKRESKYADLVILGSELFYENMGTKQPNTYLQEALHDLKCPIIVVPENFIFPESLILAYDGSNSSIYAIKQFAYLFPELIEKEALLVFANSDSKNDFPDKKEIEELVSKHFKNITLFKLSIDPKKYFSTWIENKKSAILVSGSYGRSGISVFLRKSFINDVIAAHQIPVFITHS